MWTATSVPYLAPRPKDQTDAWAEEAAEAGGRGTQTLREVTTAPAPPAVAERLRLRPGDGAVVRRRTMFLDGRPVELTDSWYPLAVAEGTAIAERRKIKGGAVTLLADLGYTAGEAEEEIEVRPATEHQASELGLPLGTSVLVLTRTTLTADDVPFEVSEMTMVTEGRRLRYRLVVS